MNNAVPHAEIDGSSVLALAPRSPSSLMRREVRPDSGPHPSGLAEDEPEDEEDDEEDDDDEDEDDEDEDEDGDDEPPRHHMPKLHSVTPKSPSTHGASAGLRQRPDPMAKANLMDNSDAYDDSEGIWHRHGDYERHHHQVLRTMDREDAMMRKLAKDEKDRIHDKRAADRARTFEERAVRGMQDGADDDQSATSPDEGDDDDSNGNDDNEVHDQTSAIRALRREVSHLEKAQERHHHGHHRHPREHEEDDSSGAGPDDSDSSSGEGYHDRPSDEDSHGHGDLYPPYDDPEHIPPEIRERIRRATEDSHPSKPAPIGYLDRRPRRRPRPRRRRRRRRRRRMAMRGRHRGRKRRTPYCQIGTASLPQPRQPATPRMVRTAPAAVPTPEPSVPAIPPGARATAQMAMGATPPRTRRTRREGGNRAQAGGPAVCRC